MEAVLSEYVTCVIEAAMTMIFCLYVMRDRLWVRLRVLVSIVALLAVCGSAVSMGLSMAAADVLPFSMDYSMLSLPFWFAAGYFLMRWATHEPASSRILVLLLSVQALHMCRSVTYFIYGLFFPTMTDGSFRWADILGFGIPSVVVTLLLAVFCHSFFSKLRGLNLKEYVRLWIIPLIFVLLYLVQTNLYPVGDFALANGFRIMISLCAFMTYSQMVSAVFQAGKAAREMETRAQLSHQLDLQRARVEDMESHSEEIKRIRHDRRQHVQVLRGLLQRGEIAEALRYLDDYEGSMAAAIQPPMCENFVADTLCRRYEALAKQAGIEVSTTMSLPKDPGIVSSDLAVILGNLWENAAAAALDVKEGSRFIRLRMQTQGDQILIRMENSYGGNVYQDGERFLSSKPGRNRAEGVGIASIRAMAAKYGGMAEFTYTPNNFTASVLLYAKTD